MNFPENNKRSSILLDHQYLGSRSEDASSGSCKDHTEDKNDHRETNEVPDENSLNASSIQQCFQNMINMTSLSDLDSRKQSVSADRRDCKILRLELRLGNFGTALGSKTTDRTHQTLKTQPIHTETPTVPMPNTISKNESPTKNEKEDKDINDSEHIEDTAKDKDKTTEVSTEKCQKEWIKFNRKFQEEVRFNALLQFTMNLLIKRWSEYLSFTPEQMRQFEKDNARTSGLTDDVLGIMEDHDLHVWQILDTVGES